MSAESETDSLRQPEHSRREGERLEPYVHIPYAPCVNDSIGTSFRIWDSALTLRLLGRSVIRTLLRYCAVHDMHAQDLSAVASIIHSGGAHCYVIAKLRAHPFLFPGVPPPHACC